VLELFKWAYPSLYAQAIK